MIEYHNPEKLAEFFALIAEHGAEKVEWTTGHLQQWYSASLIPSDAPITSLLKISDCRRLPQKKKHTVRVEVPAPLQHMPISQSWYWSVDTNATSPVRMLIWDGDTTDSLLLERGLCFATREDAEANYRAMVARSEE